MKNKVLVFGFGNKTNTNDDIAVGVIDYLRKRAGENNLELFDSTNCEKNLSECIESCDQLILIDSEHAHHQRHAICVYEGCEMDAFVNHRNNMDEHEQSLRDALGLASLKGKLPRHRALVGIHVKTAQQPVTGDINQMIGQACSKVFEITENWKI